MNSGNTTLTTHGYLYIFISMKKALITGITGQDGSYLAELLIAKGYEVHGIVRHAAIESPVHRISRISQLVKNKKITIHPASLENFASIYHVLTKVKPHEIYHLAAQSFVSYSFEDEHSTMGINIVGTHNMLSVAQQVVPKVKFYFAGSSEMFGKVAAVPQKEDTPFHPRSPYGISKVAGFDLTRYYREHKDFKMFAVSGILFNHESPRRGIQFVTRKITHTIARIKYGLEKELVLGNPDAKRDWGYAKDYVEAMWLMLQQPKPDDYVVATGETHTVKEFVDVAFEIAGLDPKKYVKYNAKDFVRPSEVDLLIGDPSKAKKALGWKPRVKFRELVKLMVKEDLKLMEKEVSKN